MTKKFILRLKSIFIPCKDNKYRPEFLKSKFLLYYAVVLLILKLIIVPFIFYFPETVFFADLTKTNLIEFANSARQDYGFSRLKESPALSQAAYFKAKDMIEKGYFDHYSPEGVSPWHWLEQVGYNYSSAGENLAIGFLEPEQVHQSWMNSFSHRQNILNSDYQEIGIATIKGNFQGSETTLVVQFLGTQRMIIPEEKPVEPLIEEVEEVPVEEVEKVEEVEEPCLPLVEEEITEEEVIKKEAFEEEGKEIASEFVAIESEEETERKPAFLLFQFMMSDYYDWLQKIIYGSLILIILSLFITVYCDVFIYHKFEIKYKDVIFETIGFSALWFVLLFLDKLFLAQLMSNNFMIN